MEAAPNGRSYTYGSVLKSNFTIKRLKKMVTTEKILQTMNSWQWGEVIAVRGKKCSGASSRSTDSDIQMTNISLQYLRSAGVVGGGGGLY